MISVDPALTSILQNFNDENYDKSVFLPKKALIFGIINNFIYVNNLGGVPLLLGEAEPKTFGKFFDSDSEGNVYYLSEHREKLVRVSNPEARPLNDQNLQKFINPVLDQIMDYHISQDTDLVLMLTFNGYLNLFSAGKIVASLNLNLSSSEKAFSMAVCAKFSLILVAYWDSRSIKPKLKLVGLETAGDEEDGMVEGGLEQRLEAGINRPRNDRRAMRKNKGLLRLFKKKRRRRNVMAIQDAGNGPQAKHPVRELLEGGGLAAGTSLKQKDQFSEFSSSCRISNMSFMCYLGEFPLFLVLQAGSDNTIHYFTVDGSDRLVKVRSEAGVYKGELKDVKMMGGEVYLVDSNMTVVRLGLDF